MSNTSKINQAINDMDSAIESMDDLRLFSQALKRIQARIQLQAGMQFSVGEKVYFNGNGNRGIIKGVITKINEKTIKVLADETQSTWTVSASLLRRQ